jgi:hypothetical protein
MFFGRKYCGGNQTTFSSFTIFFSFLSEDYYLCLDKIRLFMTISIPNLNEPSKFERLLEFLNRERIAFNVEPPPSVSEEDLIIRERLRLKYIVVGKWDAMSLDEKEDAALLETMLYEREKGVELLTPNEQTDFLNELRDLAKSSK